MTNQLTYPPYPLHPLYPLHPPTRFIHFIELSFGHSIFYSRRKGRVHFRFQT